MIRVFRFSVSILLWGVVLFAPGCREQDSPDGANTSIPLVIKVKPGTIHPDSVIPAQVIEINERSLIREKIGAPEVLPTNQNVKRVGNPSYVVSPYEKVIPDGPAEITPGTGTFALPEVIPAKGVVVPAQQPRPVTALPLRMKDAAVYNIQYLDVDQGMNSSYIWDIFEDRSGNIWMASDGGGVSRYDGKTFLHFTEKEGLASSYVRSILEDKSGNLWFATIAGVSRYDGKTFTNFTTKNGLKHNSVWALEEDNAGNLWMSTYGGGVCRFDGQSFTHFTTEQGLAGNMVWDIEEDANGVMWFASNGGGAMSYDGTSFRRYTTSEGLCDNTVLSIYEDSRGRLWFGTNGGVSVLSAASFVNYTTEQGLSMNIVRHISEDRDGNIWLGTYGAGVMKFDGTDLTWYTDKEGLSDNHIVSITEDRAGNLWMATYGGGVSKYKPGSFQHYTDLQGLKNFFIWSMAEDRSGNIWMGTNGGGIAKYDGTSFSWFRKEQGLSSDIVRTVFYDRAGVLWLGTYDAGLMKLDKEWITHYTQKDGLCGNTILDITQDDEGNLWIASDGGGVSVFDGKRFTNYTTRQGLCSNYVRSILKDRWGNIWLGTNAGLCSYDMQLQDFVRYNVGDDISMSSIWSMCEDEEGRIWFGTGGYGSIMYDGRNFTFYTEQQGLSNNSVWSIGMDHEGYLWMGTEKGLNCFALGHDTTYSRFVQFHREDGLKAEDYYLQSVLLTSDDKLWWGTGKSLTVFDRRAFHFEDKAPRIQLNNVFLQEEFVDFQNLKDSGNPAFTANEISSIHYTGVEPFQNYPQGLELPYSLNHLTFYFSATDWSAPHAIRYEYQLEGLDPDWSQPTAENKADYRNIPYGNYTFKVRAQGSTGVWSKTLEYKFVIHPPWWHTWWARTLGVLTAIALIYSYMRYRERALKTRQKELQTKVNEATSEIKLQKNLIEEKHKAITDSINYAERIQRSFLATKELLDEHLKDYFVLYLPKDVVSGDFYWASELNNGNFALVTADSTGHGVPGAIMSLLNITSLEKAVEHETHPAKILDLTRTNIIDRLSKDGTRDGGWDGMDCSFISFNFAKREMEIAAANNPVWILRNGAIIEVKPDRFPVGKHELDQEQFTNHVVQYEAGDIIYTMTDGYADQFGGPLGKKFKWKQLQHHLIEGSALPMKAQGEKMQETLANWKKEIEQIDDVCLIGIRCS